MNIHGIRLFYLLLLCTQTTTCSDDTTMTSSAMTSRANFRLAASDFGLVGHVIRRYDARNALECAQICLAEHPACKSINFNKGKKSYDVDMNCELNNATKSENPEKLQEMKNVNYYEAVTLKEAADNPEVNPKPSTTQETVVETLLQSCKGILEKNVSSPSGIYSLQNMNGSSYRVYCHMEEISECGAGGWTLVMKVNGEKNTFHYNSPYWGDKKVFNEDDGLEGMSKKEAKLPSYWNTPFTKICLGMKDKSHSVKWIVVEHTAKSLFKLVANGEFTETKVGKNQWKSLITDSELQNNCNKEGFNIDGGQQTYLRIGLVANNNNDCKSCNSCIGFGASVRGCDGKIEDMACGTLYRCAGYYINKPVFGYILVH
ncbi:uncharacterized protein LOC114515659 [Dendronephthya gigantea]|uniref:uncharacterized protein LOC114515659 n=1 Tax=Dendronephthya gigantea TaxID=151771 RepID=UPI00106A2693|nr:uncharacterized protein LOC114515659 [Dendronephthya gigantea]